MRRPAHVRAYARSIGVVPSSLTDEFTACVTYIDLYEVLDELFKDENQQAALDWVAKHYGQQLKERLNNGNEQRSDS